MDIGSKQGYPCNALSNFAPHPFVFDGVECASMEGFLQSLKFDKPHIQVEVCKLVGYTAKKRGKARNVAWKTKQTLWWKGVPFDRHSDAYQVLISAAYTALFKQSESFRRALKATRNATLTHSIGWNNPRETILTEAEFIRQLLRLRRMIPTIPEI